MSKENNSRQELIAEAKRLGLKFPPNITEEKLGLMIATDKGTTKSEATVEVSVDVLKQLQDQINELKEAKLVGAPSNTDAVDSLVKALNASAGQNGVRISKGISVADTPNREEKIARALTLIRCTVIPRDPSKVSRKAEIITMSNDLIGDLRYKVPFNLETHIPLAIYKILSDKRVNIYDDTLVSGNKQTGETMGGSKSIEAYSINVLPRLTEAELKSLARKQKLRSESLDEREDAILDQDQEEEVPKTALESAGYDL
ncbi:MAG: hypothetical protein J7J70_01930 [Deltaproteobacteria bacterium]|nr:hypothetical protein [Candidatus Tharpellaceae bacterium]